MAEATAPEPIRRARCAIYTRRSVEERGEIELSSIDAQREVCEAFIRCHSHLGWETIAKRYDDNGFSGGTIDRPALGRLLADVRSGEIDLILFYKIDRLSRSLSDFVKLSDSLPVPIVSVTQSFDTSTSLGRLILNILLTFAQFEREMLKDRIHDKLSVMRKSGLYFPAIPPLGYDKRDGRLSLNLAEAEQVRSLYRRFLHAPNMHSLMRETRAEGIKSKSHIFPNGRKHEGRLFDRATFARFLSNPVYVGRTRDGSLLPEEYFPRIVPDDLWDAVQLKHASRNDGRLQADPSRYLLRDLLFDEYGRPMISDAAKDRGNRRRYYMTCTRQTRRQKLQSRLRVRADQIEKIVLAIVDEIHENCGGLARSPKLRSDIRKSLERTVDKVTVSPTSVTVHCIRAGFVDKLHVLKLLPDSGPIFQVSRDANVVSSFGCPALFERRDAEVSVVDRKLVALLDRAERARHMLTEESSLSVRDAARRMRVRESTFSRLVRIGYLSPEIQRDIRSGNQPSSLNYEYLMRTIIPNDWSLQRRLFYS